MIVTQTMYGYTNGYFQHGLKNLLEHYVAGKHHDAKGGEMSLTILEYKERK